MQFDAAPLPAMIRSDIQSSPVIVRGNARSVGAGLKLQAKLREHEVKKVVGQPAFTLKGSA